MAHAVGRRLVTVATPVRFRVSPCEIYGAKSGTGTNLSPSESVLHCH
jgi:hypothetical protein